MDENLVYCPYCGAYNKPYRKKGEEGLFCKSCNKNMNQMITAMKQYIEDFTKYSKGEDIERIY